MMGLASSVYFVVTYCFFLAMYIIASSLVYILAVILDFKVVSRFSISLKSHIVVFLLELCRCCDCVLACLGKSYGIVRAQPPQCFSCNQIAFAFFLSVFLTKARSATVIGYIVVVLTAILAGQVHTVGIQLASSVLITSCLRPLSTPKTPQRLRCLESL